MGLIGVILVVVLILLLLGKIWASLTYWKNLTKLISINISNTDINQGLEYLPKSLVNFRYSSKERPSAKVKEIENQLKEQVGLFETYKEEKWKSYWEKLPKVKDKDHESKVIQFQLEKENLIKELEEKNQELSLLKSEQNL